VLVAALILGVCTVLLLVGAVVQVLDVRRVPVPTGPAAGDVEAGAAGVGRWPTLAWFGLAALTPLGTATVAGRHPDIGELTLVAVVLGLAAERAFYLLRRSVGADQAALRGELLAVGTALAGITFGLTV